MRQEIIHQVQYPRKCKLTTAALSGHSEETELRPEIFKAQLENESEPLSKSEQCAGVGVMTSEARVQL